MLSKYILITFFCLASIAAQAEEIDYDKVSNLLIESVESSTACLAELEEQQEHGYGCKMFYIQKNEFARIKKLPNFESKKAATKEATKAFSLMVQNYQEIERYFLLKKQSQRE